MSATKPSDIATASWDGDTEKTKITNKAARKPGYPAETVTGETVFIVKKHQDGQTGQILTDDAGNEYRDSGNGKLVEVDDIQPEEELGERLNKSVDAGEAAEAERQLQEKVSKGEVTPEEAATTRAAISGGLLSGLPGAEPIQRPPGTEPPIDSA